MNREQKVAAVAEIAEELKVSEAVFVVDYRGLSVAQTTELRDRLRESDSTLTVTKNSLTALAIDKVGEQVEPLRSHLAGPTALTYVRGDVASAAKAITTFAKDNENLPSFKGGILEGKELSAEEVTAIAKLPSREALYGQLVGLVASPITGLARGLGSMVSGLAIALGQVQEKKASGEIPSGDAPASAEAAPAEEPKAEASEEAPADDAQVTEETPADEAAEAATEGEETAEQSASESGESA